jgi:hypothetical protein
LNRESTSYRLREQVSNHPAVLSHHSALESDPLAVFCETLFEARMRTDIFCKLPVWALFTLFFSLPPVHTWQKYCPDAFIINLGLL